MMERTITYTNRKGITYYLCRGQTRTGRERYYFAREMQGDPVEEIPPGFGISESPNGVVSLIKARPSRIAPDEVVAVEEVVARHSRSSEYRMQLKHDRIEIFEDSAPDLSDVIAHLRVPADRRAAMADELRARIGGFRYAPVLRFILEDATGRIFRAERMCYLGGIDDWISLSQRGSAADLAHALIPCLGTEEFFELW